MKKEKKQHGSLAAQKLILLILHLAAFSVFVAGVSVIYCNANFKKGLRWMNSETYEESPAFNHLLSVETAEILDYVRYRDVFESGGEVDYDNEVFAYSTGAGDEEIWTVSNVLEYAEQHGYYFDNNFNVLQDTSMPQGDGVTYPVTWRAYRAEEKLAVVLGTEGEGLADKTIADCDYTVKIPMSHGVDSLNVAAASAVAFWQLGLH